jgi:hypothetical protein
MNLDGLYRFSRAKAAIAFYFPNDLGTAADQFTHQVSPLPGACVDI